MTRVLIADDDTLVLDALGTFLRDAGFQVDTATSGQEALEIGARLPPDVLICDYTFPETPDGVEVARRLRSDLPGLFVLLATGHTAQRIRDAATRSPRTELWTKPLDIFALEARLRRLPS